MHTRGLFTVIVMLASAAVASAAGCAASAQGAPDEARWALPGTPSPSGPVPVSASPVPSLPGPSSAAPSTRRTPSPTPSRPRATNGSWPPWCRLTDIRFATGFATGAGQLISGEVLMTNASGHPCGLGTYPVLRWRDAQGAAMPVTVTQVRGAVPPETPLVLQPGSTALASFSWYRYQSLNSTQTCPPFPVSLDVWLPPTVEDPHPEQGPAAHVSWATGDTASICGGTVQLEWIARKP